MPPSLVTRSLTPARRVATAVSAAALSLTLMQVAAPSAQPADAAAPRHCLALGIGSNYQWAGNLPNASKDLPGLKHAGVTSVREDIFWNVVQPNSAREWHWSSYDRLFATMTRLRVHVLPIIGYGTDWASRPATSHDMPRSKAGQSAYARFAAAVVKRYGPHGTFWTANRQLPAMPIRAVELWNEPWYAPHPSVRSYVSLLRLAGAAVHRMSRGVLTVANVDDRWTHVTDSKYNVWGQAVLAHAKEFARYIDRWAIHPYSEGQWTHLSPSTDSMRQITWLQHQLSAAKVKGYIWITELGYSTAEPKAPSAATSYRMFLRTAAHTRGAHRVTRVWIFTSSRRSAATHRGSWDYGFNLVSSSGRISPDVQLSHRAVCS